MNVMQEHASRSFYVGEDMQVQQKLLCTGEEKVTQEDIKGEYKHGILKLFVPKKEAKPHYHILRHHPDHNFFLKINISLIFCI